MRLIDRLFCDQPPEYLFHYTNVGALIGIVTDAAFFASHVYYLNDSQELAYGLGLLRDSLCVSWTDDDSFEANFSADLMSWLRSFDEPRQIFILSMSERQSLLSQWRSYTSHGKGVSIGMGADRIRAMAGHSNMRLARCRYQPVEQRQLIDSLIGMVVESYKQYRVISSTGAEAKNTSGVFFEQFREEFLQVLTVIKHPSFHEEEEWRLISPYFPVFKEEIIKYREGASMMVPYIKIPLVRNQGRSAFFDSVMLGPSRHANLGMSSLAAFLSNQGACVVTENCMIPYREW